ncbi:MAG: glycosyltransferase family 39 protein, partial [Gemmatimonadales bacterium]
MTGPLFWRRSATGWSLVAVLLIGLGVGLRLYLFPVVPPGLNQDEAAAAYEAYSLLQTGQDRWGNRLPPYFPAWGSGQSVLLSYLTAPFLALFGLSIAAVRL